MTSKGWGLLSAVISIGTIVAQQIIGNQQTKAISREMAVSIEAAARNAGIPAPETNKNT